jgi:tyrosinase
MPMPDGTTWTYTPRDMTDLSALNYSYDDLPAPPAAAPAAEQERTQAAASAEGAAMAEPTAAELVGASPTGLRMDGGDLRTQIRLDAGARQKVASSFAPGADTTLAPDAVYLNLENVRGQADSTALNVFVSVPGPTGDGQERLAGRVALFGVRKASSTDQEHAGQGLTFVLDITDIAEELHLNNALDADSISVRIAPFKPISPSAELSIGRVSIYREGS